MDRLVQHYGKHLEHCEIVLGGHGHRIMERSFRLSMRRRLSIRQEFFAVVQTRIWWRSFVEGDNKMGYWVGAALNGTSWRTLTEVFGPKFLIF